MRFYSEKPNVVIYHPTKAKMLARFNGNTLETNNKFIIDRLLSLGYKPCDGYDGMTVSKLREVAKNVNIVIPQGAKKAEIVDLLKGENRRIYESV